MGLGAREVQLRRTPRGWFDDAQVDLDPLGGEHRRLGASPDQDARHEWRRAERLHDRFGLLGGDQEIDVADGRAHAPDRPRVVGAVHPGQRRERGEDLLGEAEAHGELDAVATEVGVANGLGEVLLAASSPAVQVLKTVFVQGVEELAHRGDAEFLVDLVGALGSQARHLEQAAHAGGNLGTQILELFHRAGALELGDLAGQVRADARDRVERLLVQAGDVGPVALDHPRRLLVGAHLERIATGDGQQLGELLEHPGGGVVRAGHLFTRSWSVGSPRGEPRTRRP